MIIVAGIVTFIFTTLLTIAGEGAAIILIPTFTAMGFDLRVAMSTALLLNAIAMIFASIRYYKNKLIMYKMAIPIIIATSIFSQLGAHVSHLISSTLLNGLFASFLIYASARMLFSKPKQKQNEVQGNTGSKEIIKGISIGMIAGFLAGLLGIGGGNLILPVLIGMGINSKNASATTAFIVIFSSISGFIGHVGSESINAMLVVCAGIASITGALLGSWLMTEKLKSKHVKRIIGVVLLMVAIKKIYNIIIIMF